MSPAPARAASFSGHLAVSAAMRPDGRTTLARQSFRAPYHVSKPYWDATARVLLLQVVNPTAGILSGDRLEMRVDVEAGAALLVTTPSASRVFQMQQGRAECRQAFSVGAGGWLEVWPEPLVPHQGSLYRQITEIDVVPSAEMVFADVLMPGRLARGEKWAWQELRLETAVRIGGELILRERFAQTGAEFQALAGLAGRSESVCFANVVAISPRLDPEGEWRRAVIALHSARCWVGLSALRGPTGGWSLKLIAEDSIALRETHRAARGILAERLPRLACDPRKL
jgi:urease accessory protein